MEKTTISWNKMCFNSIPKKIETAILLFIHENNFIYLDLCKGKNLNKFVDDLIWRYGFETEKMMFFVASVNPNSTFEELLILKEKVICEKLALPRIKKINSDCLSDCTLKQFVLYDAISKRFIKRKCTLMKICILKLNKMTFSP